MMSISIQGEADIAKVLDEVSKATKNKIGLEAIVTGLTPILDAAQANAQASEDTGNLKRSIGFRARPMRRGGNIVAVIGPRRGFKVVDRQGNTRVASKYGHLVEFGHVTKGGKQVAAKPFMRPAFSAKSGQALRDIGASLGKNIELLARRKARKKKA